MHCVNLRWNLVTNSKHKTGNINKLTSTSATSKVTFYRQFSLMSTRETGATKGTKAGSIQTNLIGYTSTRYGPLTQGYIRYSPICRKDANSSWTLLRKWDDFWWYILKGKQSICHISHMSLNTISIHNLYPSSRKNNNSIYI